MFIMILLIYSIGIYVLPSVNSEVTPKVTLAGIASGFIQNEIHDITTMSADGMYVWNKW
jgi:hypothetical protein